jgi:hypothetical protein
MNIHTYTLTLKKKSYKMYLPHSPVPSLTGDHFTSRNCKKFDNAIKSPLL